MEMLDKMKIVIIGSGPAGSSAAFFLRKQGHDILIVDPLGPNEKTCGGGIPAKCLTRFAELYEGFQPAESLLNELVFSFDNKDCCTVPLPGGLGIFSRKDHDLHLFNKAMEIGCLYKKQTFKECRRLSGHWEIVSDVETHYADLLIGADGAVSRVRNKLVGKLPRQAYFKAHDYLITKKGLPLHIGFEKSLDGYLWVFPREDNCSIGIVDYGNEKDSRLSSLDAYMARFGVGKEQIIKKRSALIPSLRKEDISSHVIAGDSWALVGDAAAMVEPITGEGIYYALYSSWLMAECLTNGKDYNSEWKREFRQIVEEAGISRTSYKLLNRGIMKFMLKRSSLLRKLTGEYLVAYKPGRVSQIKFLALLPLVALQALLNKP
jgi:menaquinone-9 beta-reductase